MNSKITSVVTVAGMLFMGCASAPPKDLVDARAAYSRAASGPAAELNPAQLHVAKRTLALAEKTFDDEGNSFRARDRAYVAMRKAQLAEVQARILQADKEANQWRRQAEMSEARMIANARTEMGKAKEELAAERARREEAEAKAREALQKLEKYGSVSQDERGMVISLSGQLLFASGKSTLLPASRRKLNDVADALQQGDPNSKIFVEGHTDSRGSAQLNDALSLKRAESVRMYLISRGIPSERIEAQGFGFSKPIADNSTPEGRANNRRVEIVIAPPAGSQTGIQQPQPMPSQQQGVPQMQKPREPAPMR